MTQPWGGEEREIFRHRNNTAIYGTYRKALFQQWLYLRAVVLTCLPLIKQAFNLTIPSHRHLDALSSASLRWTVPFFFSFIVLNVGTDTVHVFFIFQVYWGMLINNCTPDICISLSDVCADIVQSLYLRLPLHHEVERTLIIVHTFLVFSSLPSPSLHSFLGIQPRALS